MALNSNQTHTTRRSSRIQNKTKMETSEPTSKTTNPEVKTRRAGKKRGTSEKELNDFADKVFGGSRNNDKSQTKNDKSKRSSKPDKFIIKPQNHSINSAVFDTLLAIDASFSRMLAICHTPGNVFRPFAILLEYSGHGLPWFLIIIYMIFTTQLAERPKLYILYNYLFSLILDVIFVGSIKSIVQRKRPSYNHSQDMHVVVKADRYSFPSGHASRVTLMAYITLTLFKGFTNSTKITIIAWAFWVCLSRVMLGRHYFTDICAGALLSIGIGTVLRKGLFLNDGIIFVIHRWLKQYF